MTQSQLQELKETISILENRPANLPDIAHSEANDALLSLEAGTLNELVPMGYRDRISAIGTALSSLARLMKSHDGHVLWCQMRDQDRLHLHGPGLTAFGVDMNRITRLTLTSEQDLLWAMEEAVTAGVAATVGVLWSEKLYDFTASKRLRMRARETGTPVLMVRSHRANGATAADWRYRIASDATGSTIGINPMFKLMGAPGWAFTLEKGRVKKSKTQHVRWNAEALRVDIPANVPDRSLVVERTKQARRRASG